MTNMNELRGRMLELLGEVDETTGEPKFTDRAVEIVKEISAYAQTTAFYDMFTEDFNNFWSEGTPPEEIWFFMLKKVVNAPTRAHQDLSVIGHMPALARALDAQRKSSEGAGKEEAGGHA